MQEKKHRKTWLALLVLLLLLLAVLLSGMTTARYNASISDTYTLTYEQSVNQIYLLGTQRTADGALLTDGETGNYLSPGGWQPLQDETGVTISNGQCLPFLLANSCHPDVIAPQNQIASLEVFVTLGAADPESITVALRDGGSEYVAVPTEVKAGSAWYNDYGPGWIYRFYNGGGEELSWSLQRGVFAFREMTLVVTGDSQAAAALSIIATAQPE